MIVFLERCYSTKAHHSSNLLFLSFHFLVRERALLNGSPTYPIRRICTAAVFALASINVVNGPTMTARAITLRVSDTQKLSTPTLPNA